MTPPFFGDNAPTSRLTVQAAWWLNTTSTTQVGVADPDLLPFRWFTDAGHTGTPDGQTRPVWEHEIEIPFPNIKSVAYTDAVGQDAPTLTIELFDFNATSAYVTGPTTDVLGDPGALSFTYGSTPDNQTLWNQQVGVAGYLGVTDGVTNYLTDEGFAFFYPAMVGMPVTINGISRTVASYVAPYTITYSGDPLPAGTGLSWAVGAPLGQLATLLRENALIRWYFGYGGAGYDSYVDAVNANVMVSKGPFLVDTVSIEASTGLITLTCRGAGGKLMLDQLLYPPVVPEGFYTSSGIQFYPPMDNPLQGWSGYGAIAQVLPLVTGRSTGGVWLQVLDACVDPSGKAYALVGTDGKVFVYSDVLFGYGGMADLGDEGSAVLTSAIVGMETTPNALGYWLCGQDGQIYNFGDAFGGGGSGNPVSAYSPQNQGGWGYNLMTQATITAPEPVINSGGVIGITKGDNNVLKYTLNGINLTITIPATQYQLASGTTTTLAEALTSAMPGVNVTLNSDNKLVFTTQGYGKGTTLKITGGNGAIDFGFRTGATLTPSAEAQGSTTINASVVSFRVTTDGKGAWLLDEAGNVYALGNAIVPTPASPGDTSYTYVGLSPTPSNKGYVVLGYQTSAPGVSKVWAFGDAPDVWPTDDVGLSADMLKMPLMLEAPDPTGTLGAPVITSIVMTGLWNHQTATLTFEPPTDLGGETITGYVVSQLSNMVSGEADNDQLPTSPGYTEVSGSPVTLTCGELSGSLPDEFAIAAKTAHGIGPWTQYYPATGLGGAVQTVSVSPGPAVMLPVQAASLPLDEHGFGQVDTIPALWVTSADGGTDIIDLGIGDASNTGNVLQHLDIPCTNPFALIDIFEIDAVNDNPVIGVLSTGADLTARQHVLPYNGGYVVGDYTPSGDEPSVWETGKDPVAVAYFPFGPTGGGGDWVVCNYGSASLSTFFPVAGGTLPPVEVGLPVGSTPNAIDASSGHWLFVTDPGNKALYVLPNTAEDTLAVAFTAVQTLPLPHISGVPNPVQVLWTQNGNVDTILPVSAWAYVVDKAQGLVHVAVTHTSADYPTDHDYSWGPPIQVGSSPGAACLVQSVATPFTDPNLPDHLYVANYDDNTVSVISLPDNKVVHTIPVGKHPVSLVTKLSYSWGPLVIVPDITDGSMSSWYYNMPVINRHVYVVNEGDSTVSDIDTATMTVVGVQDVGTSPSTAIMTDDAHLAVISATDGTVSLLDVSTPWEAQVVPGLPGAPSVISATVTGGVATVVFAPPTDDGGSTILSHTVTVHDVTTPSRGGQTTTGLGTESELRYGAGLNRILTIAGLAVTDAYTFTVKSTNTQGTGPDSKPSLVAPPTGSPSDSQPTGPGPSQYQAAAIEMDLKGTGYWVLSNANPTGQGDVTLNSYGTAQDFQIKGSSHGWPYDLNCPGSCIRVIPDGTGLYVFCEDGGVFTFSGADFYGSMPASFTQWFASNYVSWYNNGAYEADYIAVPADIQLPGDVTFPAIPYDQHNVLPDLSNPVYHNYPVSKKLLAPDYSQVVRILWAWSGGYLPPGLRAGDQPNNVYTHSPKNTVPQPLTGSQIPMLLGATGPYNDSIFDSGAYDALGPLDPSSFDKIAPKAAINNLRDALGFITRWRDDGGLYFGLPNIWMPGNFEENNGYAQTTYVPTFGMDAANGELAFQDYTLTSTDQPLRSEILVSPVDPYLYENSPPFPNEANTPPGISTTVTRMTPPTETLQLLHGIEKSALIGVPMNVPISQEDQDLMGAFQILNCWMAARTGNLVGVYDPEITCDTQIRVLDRITGETNYQYVTSLSVTHNCDQGDCLATYGTQWLGGVGNWTLNATVDNTSYDPYGNPIANQSFALGTSAFIGQTGTGYTGLLGKLRSGSSPPALQVQVLFEGLTVPTGP